MAIHLMRRIGRILTGQGLGLEPLQGLQAQGRERLLQAQQQLLALLVVLEQQLQEALQLALRQVL